MSFWLRIALFPSLLLFTTGCPSPRAPLPDLGNVPDFQLTRETGASFASAVEFGTLPTAFARVALAALLLLPLLVYSGHWPAFKQRAGSIMFVGMLN